MRFYATVTVLALAGALVATDAMAQGRRGGRNRVGGGRAVSKTALLSHDKVAADLELTSDQKEQIKALRDESRSQRRGERPNFREMSEEDRQKFFDDFRKRLAERQKLEAEKVASILNETQAKRFSEITIQIQGVRALLDKGVQTKLKLSDETSESLRSTATEAQQEMGRKMREIFQSGNRDSFQDEMANLRKDYESKLLGVLSESQKQAFEALPGKKLELTEEDRRQLSGRFGRGGRGGNRGGGGGNRRPRRESRPELE